MFKYNNRRALVTLTPKGQKHYKAFYNYYYGFRPDTKPEMVMCESKIGTIFENRRDLVSEIEYNYQWPVGGEV